LTRTVSFLLAPLPEVKVTVAVPAELAVSVAMVVPGAAGCSAGGPVNFTAPTDTPPLLLAVQLSSASAANCTTIRCPTTAFTVLGREATNSGSTGFALVFVAVGVGLVVGEVETRVGEALAVGLAVTLVFGDAVALGVTVGTVSGLDDTDGVEHPPSVIASPPTSPAAARERNEGRSTNQVCRTKPTIRRTH
jgi:hypothetical protein